MTLKCIGSREQNSSHYSLMENVQDDWIISAPSLGRNSMGWRRLDNLVSPFCERLGTKNSCEQIFAQTTGRGPQLTLSNCRIAVYIPPASKHGMLPVEVSGLLANRQHVEGSQGFAQFVKSSNWKQLLLVSVDASLFAYEDIKRGSSVVLRAIQTNPICRRITGQFVIWSITLLASLYATRDLRGAKKYQML